MDIAKDRIGSILSPYPLPVAIVGAMVDGRPNFMVASWFSSVSHRPPLVHISMGKGHCTTRGILDSGAFSVCIPDRSMLPEVIRCGSSSGWDEDKSDIFTTFRSDGGKVPMASDAPVNIECDLVQRFELGDQLLIIGEMVAVHVKGECMKGDILDLSRVDPLLYSLQENRYFGLGHPILPEQGRPAHK